MLCRRKFCIALHVLREHMSDTANGELMSYFMEEL